MFRRLVVPASARIDSRTSPFWQTRKGFNSASNTLVVCIPVSDYLTRYRAAPPWRRCTWSPSAVFRFSRVVSRKQRSVLSCGVYRRPRSDWTFCASPGYSRLSSERPSPLDASVSSSSTTADSANGRSAYNDSGATRRRVACTIRARSRADG